jgi:hypothetical protein
VSATLPSTPADRFAGIIDALCRAVAARVGWGGLTGPLVILIWSRLRRMAVRFARLAHPRSAAARATTRRTPASRPAPPRLSRAFAWLVQRVPQAAAHGSQLQQLLADPAMAALLAQTPQVGRILRPLCRLLGVPPPPGLRLPPAGRARPADRDRSLVAPATAAAIAQSTAGPAAPPPQPPARAQAPPPLGGGSTFGQRVARLVAA